MKLPPLPKPVLIAPDGYTWPTKYWTEAQVNADRLAVAEAVRAECLSACENATDLLGCADAIKNMEIET